MPLVVITYPAEFDKSVYQKDRDFLSEFGKALQAMVARELGVPDSKKAQLTPEDVEVRFETWGPRDITLFKLVVTVHVHAYKRRRRIAQQAGQNIWDAMQLFPEELTPHAVWIPTCHVWIDQPKPLEKGGRK